VASRHDELRHAMTHSGLVHGGRTQDVKMGSGMIPSHSALKTKQMPQTKGQQNAKSCIIRSGMIRQTLALIQVQHDTVAGTSLHSGMVLGEILQLARLVCTGAPQAHPQRPDDSRHPTHQGASGVLAI